MAITNIHDLKNYLNCHSYFDDDTICSVISALGFDPDHGTEEEFIELSDLFKDCSKYGADIGFSGFIYYSDTISFFEKHRSDIVSHLERTAADCGTDIISLVQSFGDFRNSDKPTASEVGKALWDSSQSWPELYPLYNVFAWYALEEIARTWYMYLEENPVVRVELSA